MTRPVPPLLPWQPCLLAYAAGILGTANLPGALCALGLLALFPRPAPGRPRTVHLALAFVLGLGAGHLAMPDPPDAPPPWLTGKRSVVASGTVDSVDPRPEDRLAVTLADVAVDGPDDAAFPLPGRLALTIDKPAFRPVPGDILRLTARLRETAGFANPGVTDFAFSRRLEGIFHRAYVRGDRNQVVCSAPGDHVLARWRETLFQRVRRALTPPPGADAADRAGRAMVLGLTFGDLSAFASRDLDLVRRASLSHTLALSGMNISYMAALGLSLAWLTGKIRPGLFLRLPRPYLTLILSVPLILGYCWLGGYSPSLYRAALMYACWGLMLLLGRQAPLFDGLFAALAAMLVAMPLAAFDARLQLSALAVAGIGLFWPPFAALAARIRLPRPVRWLAVGALGILWTSLCAEAAVLPVITRIFGEHNFNPWINAPWLPLLGAVVTPVALLGVALAAVPGLSEAATAALVLASWFCEGLMRALEWLDARHLLLSTAVLRPLWPEMLGCFGLLAALALILSGRPRPTAAMAASLALLLAPTAWRVADDARERVSLTVLDVGQGQSVAVALPGGRRLLIDAGGLFGNYDVGRAVVGAFLADGRPPRLDAALLSHPHADHVKGFVSLFQRFGIGVVHDNGGTPEAALAAPIAEALTRRGIPRTALTAGDVLDLGHGLALQVLHPGPDDDRSGNNGSLVLRLTRNGHGLALIPGDAERGVLTRLATSGVDLSAAVLILPHHGSVTGLSRRFHAAVSPRIAIASCGDNGRYPSAKVLDSLDRLGCVAYATNTHGAVTVRFEGAGSEPTVETERGKTGALSRTTGGGAAPDHGPGATPDHGPGAAPDHAGGRLPPAPRDGKAGERATWSMR